MISITLQFYLNLNIADGAQVTFNNPVSTTPNPDPLSTFTEINFFSLLI